MPPRVGQRATRSNTPGGRELNKPTQDPRATTPSASTGPVSQVKPAKAGPPKAAENLENPNVSQKNANPVRATISDLNDPDRDE